MAPGNNLADCLEMTSGVPQNTATQLTTLTAQLAYLRSNAEMILGTQASVKEICQVVDCATQLDTLLAAWAHSVPREWEVVATNNFETPMSVQRQDFVYEDRIDVYFDITVAEIWNSYRVTRIKVLSIICDCFAALRQPLTVSGRRRKDFALATLQEIVDGICGSVPFHLGTKTRSGTEDQVDVEYPYITSKAAKDLRRACAGQGGWGLIEPHYEPLKNALSVPSIRAGQKEWILGQLTRIGRLYALTPSRVTNPTMNVGSSPKS